MPTVPQRAIFHKAWSDPTAPANNPRNFPIGSNVRVTDQDLLDRIDSADVAHISANFDLGSPGDIGNGTAGNAWFNNLVVGAVALFAAGSAAAPALAASGDANTGIYFPAADQVGIAVGGSSGLVVTPSGVGVGTTSPGDPLTVVGSITARQINNAQDAVKLLAGSGSGAIQVFDSGAQTVAISGNSNASYLNGGGSFGIGTNSPVAQCEIVNSSTGRAWVASSVTELLVERNGAAAVAIIGSSVASSRLYFGDTDDESVGGLEYDHSTDSLLISVNGSVGAALNSTGLGIGTTSPSANYHQVSGATAATPTLGSATGASWLLGGNPTYGLAIGNNAANGDVWLQSMSWASAVAYSLLLNPMGGNVGIGLGAAAPGQALDVAGAIRTQGWGGSANNGNIFFGTHANAAQIYGTNAVVALFVAGSERVRVDGSGVGFGTTSPGARLHAVESTNGVRIAKFENSANATGLSIIGTSGSANLIQADAGESIQIEADNGSGARWILNASANGNAYLLSGGDNVVDHGKTYHRWYISDADAMYLNATGLGIGTTSPQARLHVISTGTTTAEFTRSDNGQILELDGNGYSGHHTLDGTAYFIGHNSGSRGLGLQTGNSTRLYVTPGGNVGIGLTNPGYHLDVSGGIRTQGWGADVNSGNLLFGVSANAAQIFGNASILAVYAAGVERLRVSATTGATGGSGSAGAGNQYVELNLNGQRYKLLHDGTL